ncbi:MAG: phosphoenolpyruvate carboxylase [Flavobacteriaceae bacterium]
MARVSKLNRFNEHVLSKFNIYNSIFTSLPYEEASKTGLYLPLFHELCEEGFKEGKTPTDIVVDFFEQYFPSIEEKDRIDTLFQFIQYIERQIVLFDAIEDAAFPIVNNMEGVGTLRGIKELAAQAGKKRDLKKFIREFSTRIVLTAHPTQFYPGTVLGIITELSKAIEKDNLKRIQELLAQLGKTAFFNKEKPTPYDEAKSLIWYLENIFYYSVGAIFDYVQDSILNGEELNHEVIQLGFWPGGDRDGNPFVTEQTTVDVAKKLRLTLLKNYYRDAKALRKKLTFKGVYDKIIDVETRLWNGATSRKGTMYITQDELLSSMLQIKDLVISQHNSLYLEEINSFITKIKMFGMHFATLDIRQDSRVHHTVFTQIVSDLQASGDKTFPADYSRWDADKQTHFLATVKGDLDLSLFSDDMVLKTLGSIKALQEIQESNGEKGANRYIISNNQTALNMMQTFAMLNLSGFGGDLPVDVIPLFETIDDLKVAQEVMKTLYEIPEYREHLKQRNNTQTIMLGYSDGTKDGGYLMANWSIFKAKETLTAISRMYGISVLFFDGRGGPPARGGGKTHQFYSSLGSSIETKEVQLTIQGQTISSNFGTQKSSRYNLEQLLSSGLSNKLFSEDRIEFNSEERVIIQDLAEKSYKTYEDFKSHKLFIPYLERMSTLKFYGKANIGSRPSKRSTSKELDFGDLRAIPFVGSWSQLKQNVPGYYGLGTALKAYEDQGRLGEVKMLYRSSKFFKTLMENSMMSLTKSFFGLTQYMEKDPEFGEFWKIIHDEYVLTKRLLLEVSGHSELMENMPDGRASIKIRESIVMPLLTIQQFALKKIQDMEKQGESIDPEIQEVFEKIVTRSLFGNTNAARNSA